jgi:hypothetical protein
MTRGKHSICFPANTRRSSLRWIIAPVAALLTILGLGGCAYPSGRVVPARPALISKPVSMDNIQVSTSSDVGNAGAEVRSLNDAVLSGLRETGLFASVSEVDASTNSIAQPGIRVQSTITAIKPISTASRDWFGGLAGQAKIVAQVTVSDVNSGKTIETFEAIGLSGSTAKAGTTLEAIQSAAAAIVAELARINSRTVELL